MKVVQLLGSWKPLWHQECKDTDFLHCRSYGPIRIFFQASCRWCSKGFFGQSFSIAPPVEALSGLLCLGSFFVVQYVRYIEQPPGLGSYLVNWCIRHLKGHPGWGPTL